MISETRFLVWWGTGSDRGEARNRVSFTKYGGSSHNHPRNPVSGLVGYGKVREAIAPFFQQKIYLDHQML